MWSSPIPLFLILTALSTVSSQCVSSVYGPDCRYDCHCAPNVICNPQTGCNGNCATGWDGATCQRRNVALSRPTSQVSTYCGGGVCFPANYAVDGRTGNDLYDTPCTITRQSSPAFWTVILDSVYWIHRFVIYNREHLGGRLNRFRLSVGNTSDLHYQECYRDHTTSTDGPGDVIVGTCNQNAAVSGNMIRISVSNYLTLCEVLIYVCSPGWYGEECEYECVTTTSCLRCDITGIRCQECVRGRWGEHCGNVCGQCWNNNPCDKENGECPVTTGTPRCEAGYSGVQCTNACNFGSYGPDCEHTCGFCAQGMAVCDRGTGDCPDQHPRCQPGKSGTHCKTDCVAGTYGADCLGTCGACAGGPQFCNRTSGLCSNTNPKCIAGFHGNRCKQVCGAGTYGPDCTARCGRCAEGQTRCDIETGNCPDRPDLPRCMAGYTTLKCDHECEVGVWGPDCQTECRHCYNGEVCDKFSGACPILPGNPHCDPGYLELNCSIPCPGGRFGHLCEESCGHCLGGNLTCNHETGTCNNCQAGWQGQLCKQGCSPGTFGPNCKLICSMNCLEGPTGCDVVSGVCFRGCQRGFSGDYCSPFPSLMSVLKQIRKSLDRRLQLEIESLELEEGRLLLEGQSGNLTGGAANMTSDFVG